MSFGRYLFLLLVPLVPWSQGRIEASFGRYRAQHDVLYLWSGEKVKILSHGFEDLMADLYWLRTVQYYGNERAFSKEHDYNLLLPLTEITTTLDPRFEIAYRYGAIFLSEARPHGAGNPEAGLALLEKGVVRNPQWWRLRFDMGALEFFTLKDPKRAAATLLDAAKLPGAPFWLRTLAASMLGQGGERQTARELWTQMYQQDEGFLRENALVQLKKLDALDEIDGIARFVSTFVARTGRPPRSLLELQEAGLLRGPTRDPTGVPFAYDPNTGSVSIAPQSSLWTQRLPGS